MISCDEDYGAQDNKGSDSNEGCFLYEVFDIVEVPDFVLRVYIAVDICIGIFSIPHEIFCFCESIFLSFVRSEFGELLIKKMCIKNYAEQRHCDNSSA